MSNVCIDETKSQKCVKPFGIAVVLVTNNKQDADFLICPFWIAD